MPSSGQSWPTRKIASGSPRRRPTRRRSARAAVTQSPIAGHLPVLVVRLSNARRGQCGAEHRGAPCAPYRFRVPVEGGDPRGTGAPVQRAKGVQHPIRWEGFHRRPASDQSLLRCGKASRGSDVKKGEATTRFGGCLDNSIVPSTLSQLLGSMRPLSSANKVIARSQARPHLTRADRPHGL